MREHQERHVGELENKSTALYLHTLALLLISELQPLPKDAAQIIVALQEGDGFVEIHTSPACRDGRSLWADVLAPEIFRRQVQSACDP